MRCLNPRTAGPGEPEHRDLHPCLSNTLQETHHNARNQNGIQANEPQKALYIHVTKAPGGPTTPLSPALPAVALKEHIRVLERALNLIFITQKHMKLDREIIVLTF